jgi:hypothetical protein
MIRYRESFGYGGRNALTNVSNDLMHVNILVEDRSQQSVTFTHVLRGSTTCVPTHAPSGPVLSYPLQCPTS